MPRRIDSVSVAFAEQHRHLLPEGFMQEVDALEAELVQNRSIQSMITKGRGRTWKTSNVGIRAAILEELRLFLCTDHSRYKNLRTQGKKLTKDAILFIAGVIGGTLSLPAGVATACVAFIALACLRVGAGTFCWLIPSPAQEQHNAPETKKLKRRRTNVKAIN